MILEIKKYPNPILKKKSEEVKEVTPEIKRLLEDMAETMEKNNGIGIAAPQVGVSKRVIVVGTEKGPLGLINPKIIKKSKETEIIEEGCLSFPGLFLKIKRPKSVEIETLGIDGKKIHLETKELFSKSPATERYPAGVIIARIIQHEIDHLDGILIIDRISFWQKLKLKLNLKNSDRRRASVR